LDTYAYLDCTLFKRVAPIKTEIIVGMRFPASGRQAVSGIFRSNIHFNDCRLAMNHHMRLIVMMVPTLFENAGRTSAYNHMAQKPAASVAK
jgi:hypothetical protein